MSDTISRQQRTEVISTKDGPIRGYVHEGLRSFLGIPYAAPPVNSLRWRPPEPSKAWAETLDAVDFGKVCAQDNPCFPGFGHFSYTEDCLYLNVVTPADVTGKKLPVLVLIHGGGLYCGASNDYDPRRLVKQGNLVFVSFNYRLGVFGFFSHPVINAEAHPAGNYGTMDQQFALKWVQRNIGHFGGDSSNVTIMGESAGAISVMSHIVSPGSKGLFHRAIVQSSGPLATVQYPSLESKEEKGIALMKAAGCTTAEPSPSQMRHIPTTQIMAADAVPEDAFDVGRYPMGLMEDGAIIPRSLRQRFLAGQFNRVPLLLGVTTDEFAWFQGMMEVRTGKMVSAELYPKFLGRAFNAGDGLNLHGLSIPLDGISQILERYPVQAHSCPSRAAAAALGDASFISTAGRRTARVIKQFVEDVYVYEFDVPDAPVAWPEVSFPYGSTHTQELQFLFHLFHGASGKSQPLNEPQMKLSRQMVDYWTAFATNGTPNGAKGPEAASSSAQAPVWDLYDPGDDNVMLLSTPLPQMIKAWGRRHHSDFWDTFYPLVSSS